MTCCGGPYRKDTYKDGTVVVTDTETGAQLTQAEVDALNLVPCPKKDVRMNDVCIRPNASDDITENVDGIESLTIACGNDGTVAILKKQLFDDTGADVTDTHKIVPCICPANVVSSEALCESDGQAATQAKV